MRELENVLSRLTLRAAAGVVRGGTVVLSRQHLGADFAGAGEGAVAQTERPETSAARTLGLKEATREFQRSLIQETLSAHDGNWAATARALGMHRSNLHHLAVRLGLK